MNRPDRASIPRIALTPGEPAGIGPDLCIQLAQQTHPAELVLVASAKLLQERAEHLGLPLQLHRYDPAQPPLPQASERIYVLDVPLQVPVDPGRLQMNNAQYVLETLRIACDGCLRGSFDALVTGPVHKGIINQAGWSFTGHTEFLAERCRAHPVMMLVAAGMRVALLTTHVPLADVSQQITPERLRRVIRILHQDLQQRFGLPAPRILVCGLNPHAGEGGYLGMEEVEVIAPVLEELRRQGLQIRGPLPADTLFTSKYLQQADAIVAMYHDQGLPVLKHVGFGRAVNITLGLPIIRTSVDHGTALDLAGSGHANSGSLLAALGTAIELAGHSA